jgi:hypothetical protein
LKEKHPFLCDEIHRSKVIAEVEGFLTRNFNLKINQILIGHLFFGQRAFPISGKDIGMVYDSNVKYYPDGQESEFKEGPIILIDEVGSSFDIGIGQILRDDVGLYFENILINIKILKKEESVLECFKQNNYFLQIYHINNYGVLKELELHSAESIIKYSSLFIQNFILFNLIKLSASS